MPTTTGNWIGEAEAFGTQHPALSRAIFAAVTELLTDEERQEYERVLDAALASAAGDRDLAMGLLRHQLLDEPRVTEMHLRVERLWLLILDEVRTILACSEHILR